MVANGGGAIVWVLLDVRVVRLSVGGRSERVLHSRCESVLVLWVISGSGRCYGCSQVGTLVASRRDLSGRHVAGVEHCRSWLGGGGSSGLLVGSSG